MKKKKYAGTVTAGKHIVSGAQKNNITKETFKNISELNVNRGNIKGFIFENLHAQELNYELSEKGLKAIVLDNNGIADIEIIDIKTGKLVTKLQAKCGYEKLTSVKDLKKYTDQILIINKDAKNFAELLEKNGIPYQKSNITNEEVSKIANNMKKEGSYLNTKNAKLTSSAYQTKEVLKNCHTSGVNAAKSGACFGAGVSMGSNMVDVIYGDKELNEAAVDIAKDTVIAGAAGYVAGAAGSAIASTAVGGAAIGAATTIGTTIAGTTIGGAVVGAATSAGATIATGGAVAGTALAAGTAAVGGAVATGVTAVGTAVGGTIAAVGATTVGGAVVAGAAATGAAVTAGAAVVGAAAVAAAPVVAVGAAVGVVWSLGKKLFGD